MNDLCTENISPKAKLEKRKKKTTFQTEPSGSLIRVVAVVGAVALRLAPAHDILRRAPVVAVVPDPAVALKLGPPLHGDLAAVKLALVLDARLLSLLARRLPRVAPREVVELPERV